MLKKNQRLSKSEFANLLKKGRRIHSDHLTLVYVPSESTKCGVVVSKKVANRAHARNLLRRRVYDIFGKNLTILGNKHIALLTKSSITKLSYTELAQCIEDGIHKTM